MFGNKKDDDDDDDDDDDIKSTSYVARSLSSQKHYEK